MVRSILRVSQGGIDTRQDREYAIARIEQETFVGESGVKGVSPNTLGKCAALSHLGKQNDVRIVGILDEPVRSKSV